LIEGFRTDSFDYHITFPYGTTTLPELTYQEGKEEQKVTVDTISQDSNTTIYIFTVIAPNEEAASEYVVKLEVKLNNDSKLKDLLINGKEVDKFNADSTNYIITYPIGTDSTAFAKIEDITATPKDTNAIIDIQQKASTIYILVTAADGETTTTYMINQVILQSSNTRLSAIYIDSLLIRGFDPELTEYVYYVAETQPTIHAIAEDSTSNISYGHYTVDSPFHIYIEAEDGSEQIYTINFIQSTIQSSATPNVLDVLMKHISGTNQIAFASLRKNVSVAVYMENGQLLFHAPVPESTQNDVILITNAAGQEQLIDVYNPFTTYTLPNENQTYIYVFLEDNKRRIHSGKLFFKQ
jgi:hypothetical protein